MGRSTVLSSTFSFLDQAFKSWWKICFGQLDREGWREARVNPWPDDINLWNFWFFFLLKHEQDKYGWLIDWLNTLLFLLCFLIRCASKNIGLGFYQCLHMPATWIFLLKNLNGRETYCRWSQFQRKEVHAKGFWKNRRKKLYFQGGTVSSSQTPIEGECDGTCLSGATNTTNGIITVTKAIFKHLHCLCLFKTSQECKTALTSQY